MITYQLYCSHGHNFEAWFKNFDSYQAQKEAMQISCPICSDTNISKELSAPNINSKSSQSLLEHVHKMQENLNKLQHYIENNFNDVGDKFADEARKLSEKYQEYRDDNDESTVKGIYGSATHDELQELHDDGIDFYALPIINKDKKH